MAGRMARRSSARSGWRSAYSWTEGRSPRRQRWANSSASWSSRSQRPEEGASISGAPQAAQGRLEPLQRPDVALGGGGLLDAEHLGGLGAGELLEVAQGEDLAIDRVE